MTESHETTMIQVRRGGEANAELECQTLHKEHSLTYILVCGWASCVCVRFLLSLVLVDLKPSVSRRTCYHNHRACSFTVHKPGPPDGGALKANFPIKPPIWTATSMHTTVYMRPSSACLNCSPPHDTTDQVTAIDVLQDCAAGGQHHPSWNIPAGELEKIFHFHFHV